VEAGLQIADAQGGEVTVVSMGPEPATSAVRKALSMGVHKAVMITDGSLRGSDALATAKVLAAAIKRQEFDLVIAGVESTDGYTGTLPMALAEMLGVPNVTFARKLDVSDGTAKVERQTALGYDTVECPLPVVVTVTAGATEPRYPTLKGIMQAKQKPLEKLSLSDLQLSSEDVAPTQRVEAVKDAPEKGPGEVIEDLDQGVTRAVQFLSDAKVI
jgi:electron transfer flavoprotein beta subunit